MPEPEFLNPAGATVTAGEISGAEVTQGEIAGATAEPGPFEPPEPEEE